MSAPPKYQPAWLQPTEALWLCMKAGIEWEQATSCLARVWHDQGSPSIAWDDVADPVRNLLRFDPAMKQHPYYGLCCKAGVDPLSARRMFTLWMGQGDAVAAVPENRPPLKGHGEIDWLRFIQFCKIPVFRKPTDADAASDLVLAELNDDDIQAVDLSYIEIMPFEVSHQQFVKLLPKQKSAAGRKGHDWDAVETRVRELMDHHGDFMPGDEEGWNSRAKLVEQLQDESKIGRTQLNEKVPPMIERWRQSKKFGN